MNKQFILKMMQAKRLEYEALKEIVPEALRERLASVEAEAKNTVRECIYEIYFDGNRQGSAREEEKDQDQNSYDQAQSKHVKKILIR